MGIVTFAIAVGYDGPSRSVVQRSLRNRVRLEFTFIFIFWEASMVCIKSAAFDLDHDLYSTQHILANTRSWRHTL